MSALAPPLTSPKPYLIRAWHEWMTDNGLTPHILVRVDATVAVPREYVQNNEIVLNVSYDATGSMSLGNDAICFQARFAGRVREIVVPIERVASIFARENGQGMVFEALLAEDDESDGDADESSTAQTTVDHSTAPQSHGLALVGKPDAAATSDGKKVEKPSRASPGEPDDQPPSPPSPPKGGGLKVVK